MSKQKVELLLLDSYLATVKNSLGSKLFKNLFAKVNGKRKDILENGSLSCAVFVSGILLFFGLIKEMHATVNGLIKDLEKSGWKKIAQPKPGSIIIWDYKKYDSGYHLHSGFYIGNNKAISNSTEEGFPVKHHWTYGQNKGQPRWNRRGQPQRKVIAIYWHKNLK